jgi:hypothetical protein
MSTISWPNHYLTITDFADTIEDTVLQFPQKGTFSRGSIESRHACINLLPIHPPCSSP